VNHISTWLSAVPCAAGGKLWFNLGTEAQYSSYPEFVQGLCPLESTFAFIGIYQNAAFVSAPWASCLYRPPAPPPPAPPPAPPGMQLGAGGSRLPVNTVLRALAGTICLSPGSSGSGSGSAGVYTPCGNLTKHRVVLNGDLTFAALGGELEVGDGMFNLQRKFSWTFINATKTFTADVTLSSTMTVKLWNLTSNTSSESTLECLVAGKVQLQSKAYPGPGFSGTFDWRGNLAISPNPWDFWDASRPVSSGSIRGTTRRRMLQVEGSGSLLPAAPAGSMQYAGRQLCGTGGGGLDLLGRPLPCASSSSSGSISGRALLAPARNSNASVVALAAGPVTTLEVTTRSMDSVYNISWLDPEGELLLANAADIPSIMVPAWRAVPKPSSKLAQTLMGAVIGVLGLAIVGVVVFIVVKKVRERAAARREEEEDRVDAYEVDGQPFRGPPKPAGRPPHTGQHNQRVAHQRHHHQQPPSQQQQWRGASRDGPPPRTGQQQQQQRVRGTSELDGPARGGSGMMAPPGSSDKELLGPPFKQPPMTPPPPATGGGRPMSGGSPAPAWGPNGAPGTGDW
jgi:hypothetical protein